MQLDLFSMTVHMRCIDPVRNKRRYYALTLEKTLFGQWAVVREWGRIGSCTGQKLENWFDEAAVAWAFIKEIQAQKRRRGYV